MSALALLALPLAMTGLHRLFLGLAPRGAPPERRTPERWPSVTVQVPLFEERDVAERAIAAAGALKYPGELQIQVLDDSRDDTTARARAAVEALRARGVEAALLHRAHRAGYKAGALQAGLESARGELVAVLDADFLPAPDWLRRMVPYFCAPEVGMVQARWAHLNAQRSALTRAQALLLDTHFTVEHGGRAALGLWFNFNGTAGIWRRAAIEGGGGWAGDTLTEDLDLSYRAQLAGWRFVYAEEVEVAAELPEDWPAFRQQQRRWAQGSIQVARKLLPTVWRSGAPLRHKLEASAHLAGNLAWIPGLLATLALPAALATDAVAAWIFGLGPLAMAGAHLITLARRGELGRAGAIPLALAVGAGLAPSQVWAVIQGFRGGEREFVRTPKRGDGPGSYISRRKLRPAEALLALWTLGGAAAALSMGRPLAAGLMMVPGVGFTLAFLGSVRGTPRT